MGPDCEYILLQPLCVQIKQFCALIKNNACRTVSNEVQYKVSITKVERECRAIS